jgi:hypothetical protein
MTTFNVKTSPGAGESPNPAHAANAAAAAGGGNHTIDIYDGVYIMTGTIMVMQDNITFQSNSGNKGAVHIVRNASSQHTFQLNKGTTGTLIKNLSIHASGASSVAIQGLGTMGTSDKNHAVYTLQDCYIKAKEYGAAYMGSGTIIQRCIFEGKESSDSGNYLIYHNTTGSQGLKVDSCLLKSWGKAGIYSQTGHLRARNNTLIISSSAQSTNYGIYAGSSENNNIVTNNILYSNDGEGGWAIRFGAAHSSNVCKNNIVWGSWDDNEYFRHDTGPNENNLSSSIITNSGSAVVINTTTNFHPHADGLAFQSGLGGAGNFPTTDLSGSNFNSTPSRGAFEALATGWSAGEKVNYVALASIEKINNFAKANIEKVNGL